MEKRKATRLQVPLVTPRQYTDDTPRMWGPTYMICVNHEMFCQSLKMLAQGTSARASIQIKRKRYHENLWSLAVATGNRKVNLELLESCKIPGYPGRGWRYWERWVRAKDGCASVFSQFAKWQWCPTSKRFPLIIPNMLCYESMGGLQRFLWGGLCTL